MESCIPDDFSRDREKKCYPPLKQFSSLYGIKEICKHILVSRAKLLVQLGNSYIS